MVLTLAGDEELLGRQTALQAEAKDLLEEPDMDRCLLRLQPAACHRELCLLRDVLAEARHHDAEWLLDPAQPS